MLKPKKRPLHFSSLIVALAMSMALASCVGDPGAAKRRGLVKDFSIASNEKGCGKDYFIYAAPFDTCATSCSAYKPADKSTFRLPTTEELAEIKQELVDTSNSTLLETVNASANICIRDAAADKRPTNDIDIKSDFCSCINGKPDIISDCESFCANKPVTEQPTLYVNTIIGPTIALNTKLGDLYKWCTVQLPDDVDSPQCSLTATDGVNTITNIPVTVIPGSNSFSANIQSLTPERTWIVKIVEAKTGSMAQSKEFQIRRKIQPSDTGGIVGALKVAPINQYTCLSYGGKVDALGNIIRTNYTRIYYYFAANETPPPMPPVSGSNQATTVCHDEQAHPGVSDSPEFDRLELIPEAYAMWDKSDTRFVAKAENGGKLTINKILEERLAQEYQITSKTSIDLFRLISFPNRPTTASTSSASTPLGYIMTPFVDDAGKAYCPTSTHFNGNQPLLNLLGEYMDDTEGLFLGEKEAEIIQDKPVYSVMFVRESTLKSYGFYIENGLRVKANAAAMHTKTIYFYWPTSTTADPLLAGGRKLFTVRSPDTLSGQAPTGQATSERTSDKRIGCIPKSSRI